MIAIVLLLTGATGLVGSALLRRLMARREPVRCLVRDPRRLGPDRVRVQITIGDLTDPRAYRQALRGARVVVHLAASHRDQPHATIEELAGLATWRLLRAAEQAGVEHFVFFSALGATRDAPQPPAPGQGGGRAGGRGGRAPHHDVRAVARLLARRPPARAARAPRVAARGAAGGPRAGVHAADLGRRRRRLRDRRARPPAGRRRPTPLRAGGPGCALPPRGRRAGPARRAPPPPARAGARARPAPAAAGLRDAHGPGRGRDLGRGGAALRDDAHAARHRRRRGARRPAARAAGGPRAV